MPKLMSFNTTISLDVCIISARKSANLHKSNMLEIVIFMMINSKFLVIQILVRGCMPCERTVDQ